MTFCCILISSTLSAVIYHIKHVQSVIYARYYLFKLPEFVL